MREFSDPQRLRAIEEEALAEPPPKPLPPRQPPGAGAPAKGEKQPKKTRHREPPRAEGKGDFGQGVFDPFPPGYAEDLLSDDEGESPRDAPGND